MINPTCQQVVDELQSLANPANVAGMARFAINSHNTLGISTYTLRPMAKRIGVNHPLALELWQTGIHEARILAVFLDDPKQVTPQQMDDWAAGFDSWDTCDQACTSLFDLTPHAYAKAYAWSERPEEFVRRGAFALMAGLAVHDKLATDEQLAAFFPVIQRAATDPRNFVKKAVNWALRNIGKRNLALNQRAVAAAMDIKQIDDKTARWIAADALRELTSEKIRSRL